MRSRLPATPTLRYGVDVIPFRLAYHHASPHGILTAVHLPVEPSPIPSEILEQLHPEEVACAEDYRGLRKISFVGGRMAMRFAAQQLGVRPPPIRCDELGAPVLPAGLVGSISHKRSLAIALVSRDHGATLGIDLEEFEPERPGVARKVLTPRELEAVQALPLDRQWISILQRFSVKESIYKAISPWVRRYVGFQEAEVWPDTNGGARVDLHLTHGEGPFQVEARYDWLHGRLLTSVRILPLPPVQAAPSMPE